MAEREIKKLELQSGLVPFDEWFDSLRDLKMQAAVTNAAKPATSAVRNCGGNNSRNMRLKNYRNDLKKRLRDPEYAAEYLAQVLADKDSAAFLIALKDVVEAGGGMGNLAGRVGLKRPSLYKILSKNGNPTLETLQEILAPLGLRVSVALDEAA
jgi:probable addiction module antidote protein